MLSSISRNYTQVSQMMLAQAGKTVNDDIDRNFYCFFYCFSDCFYVTWYRLYVSVLLINATSSNRNFEMVKFTNEQRSCKFIYQLLINPTHTAIFRRGAVFQNMQNMLIRYKRKENGYTKKRDKKKENRKQHVSAGSCGVWGGCSYANRKREGWQMQGNGSKLLDQPCPCHISAALGSVQPSSSVNNELAR